MIETVNPIPKKALFNAKMVDGFWVAVSSDGQMTVRAADLEELPANIHRALTSNLFVGECQINIEGMPVLCETPRRHGVIIPKAEPGTR